MNCYESEAFGPIPPHLMRKCSGSTLPDPVAVNCSSKRCSARGEEPPCLPPIPPSNEDQRRGYQALNQPQVHFTYVLMNLRSCAEPSELRGSCCRALSAFLRGHRQWKHMGYRWQATPWHRQATPQCLIMWYSEEPGAGLFARSWSHAVICREACWTPSCCCRVNLRLSELGGFACDWQEGFLESAMWNLTGSLFFRSIVHSDIKFLIMWSSAVIM